MKVLFDTNILFSALYSPDSLPHRAFLKAGEEPYQALICEESLKELRRNFLRKYPAKAPLLDRFVMLLMATAEIVPVPGEEYPEEELIDDPDDHLLLRAAIHEGAVYLVSGDAHFLDSEVQAPVIMTARAFLELES